MTRLKARRFDERKERPRPRGLLARLALRRASLARVLAAGWLTLAWASGPSSFLPFPEALPILRALGAKRPPELAGLSDDRLREAWPGWVRERDREVRERLLRGEADAVVNLLFYGTSFTDAPRLTIDFVRSAAKDEPDRIFRKRVRDLAAAVAGDRGDERIALAKSVVARSRSAPGGAAGRDATSSWLLQNAARVREETAAFARKLQELNALETATERFAARSTLFRERGIALDTSLRPAFAVERALEGAVTRGLLKREGVRRAAVVGPGLDLVDKAEGLDYYPPQSIQVYALMDSLLRLGLARADALHVTAFDISPAVLDHLARARRRAAAGEGYLIQLPLPEGPPWRPEFVEYWRRFGDASGEPVAASAPPKTAGRVSVRAVRVRPRLAARMSAVDLNVVYESPEREAAEGYDLVVATNVLVYYDTFEQCLAAANLARMMVEGGVLVSNNALLELPGAPLRSAGYETVVYSDKPTDGDHVVFYRRQ